MQYEYKLINNIPVITFDHDNGKLIGGDVQIFGEEILSRFNGESDRFVFDLRNISCFNSFAVGELVGIRNYFLDKGFDCILIIDNGKIIKLFEMVGIMDLFQTVSSENQI